MVARHLHKANIIAHWQNITWPKRTGREGKANADAGQKLRFHFVLEQMLDNQTTVIMDRRGSNPFEEHPSNRPCLEILSWVWVKPMWLHLVLPYLPRPRWKRMKEKSMRQRAWYKKSRQGCEWFTATVAAGQLCSFASLFDWLTSKSKHLYNLQ